MCRLALVIGDIPFEDDRFSKEEWPDRKSRTPYGSCPTLFVDGQQFAQSHAMLRYCGKLSGLYPTDPLAALKVDEIIDVFNDVALALTRGDLADPENLRQSREKFVKEDVPRYIGGLEKRVQSFGGELWAVGDQLTIADLIIYGMLGYMKHRDIKYIENTVVDGFVRLNRIYNGVREHPKVVAWNRTQEKA